MVDGPINGATVEIYDFTGNVRGAKLGTGTTDSNGNYTITLSPRPTGPVQVVASGGSYTDDATGNTVTLGSTDQLTEIVPQSSIVSGTLSAHVNPLNHIAASLVTSTAGTLGIDNAITSAKGVLGQQYGISVTDLGTTPPVNASNPNPDTAPTLNQKQSGVVIAGISQLAKNLNVRPIDLIKAIADDYSDGKLDGKKGTASITIPLIGGGTTTLQATTALGDLQTSMNTFLGSTQNKSGLTMMPQIATTPITAPTTNSGAVFLKSDMIPAFVTLQPSLFQLQAGGGTPPYTWVGLTNCPNASVSTGGQLSATGAALPPGTSMSISTPCEITVTDTRNQSAKLTFRITTVAAAPSITTQGATLETGKNVAIPIASATGGTPPYFFMKEAGATLPPGMNVLSSASNAMLSGTPTLAGTYPFNVCAADLGKTPKCASVTVIVNDPPKANLTTIVSGTGFGNITTSVQGTSCGASCQSFPVGTQVTLTATPGNASTFSGWSSGPCTGTSTCTITLNANTTVTGTFTPAVTTVNVTKQTAGTGGGTITTSPAGTSCGTNCVSFNSGTSVTLTATPASGSTFAGWSGGGCTGSGTCTFVINSATTVTATFNSASAGGLNCPSLSGAGSSGLAFTGTTSYSGLTTAPSTFHPSITIGYGINYANTNSVSSSSGSIKFTLWAFPSSFVDGMQGIRIATFTPNFTGSGAKSADELFNFSSVTNATSSASGTTPGAGDYCIVLFLEHVTSACPTTDHFCFSDYRQFPNPATFGTGGGGGTGGTATLTLTGASGDGSFSVSPSGTSCGPDCYIFNKGTSVTITPVPSSTFSFNGWSGGGCTGTSACTITLNADTTTAGSFIFAPIKGTWSGNWNWTGPGISQSGQVGCTFIDAGTISMVISTSGKTFTGTVNANGFQLRDFNANCALVGTDTGTGTITGSWTDPVLGVGSTLTYNLVFPGTFSSLNFSGTATLGNTGTSSNTVNGIHFSLSSSNMVRTTGGLGGFTLSRQ